VKIIFDFKGSIFGQKEKITLDVPEKATLIESLQIICKQVPSLNPLLFQNESLRNDIVVLVDRIDVKTMNLLSIPLKENQQITILPLAHGG
jgi:hypothetical protein